MHLGHVDLAIVGYPRNGFSSAGKALGLDDTRTTLFFEAHRILHLINSLQEHPCAYLFENVVPTMSNTLISNHTWNWWNI
jgi:site-specific DNA-cytosine methylase